jgi:hypothetical protein
MMSAKLRKPRKRTSSFSKREKILRKPAEEPLYLIALLVERAVVVPGFDSVGFGRNHRDHAQAEDKLAGLIALIGSIHQQRQAFRHRPEVMQ